MEMKDTLSSCSYSDEQDMQQMLKQEKILKGSCLNGLSALRSNFTRKLEQGITKSEFEHAFSHIFGEDVDTFTRTFSQNMDTLEQQLTKETILESNCQNAFRVLKTQFEKIFSSVLIKPSSLDGMYARKDFHAYTSMEPQLFKETILKNFDFIEDYMLKTIIHAQTIQKRLDDKKLQIQECIVQEVKALDTISEDKEKKSCMVSFRKLHSHLKHLSHDNFKGTRIESGFKRAFTTLFGQDVETFIGTMFLNVDQLEKQLDKEEFQEIGSIASFKVLETQFQMFIKSRMYLDDEFVVLRLNCRDVRTLAIEEAYMTKYSIHPGVDTRGPELTWERKDQIRSKCLQLFVDSDIASSVKSVDEIFSRLGYCDNRGLSSFHFSILYIDTMCCDDIHSCLRLAFPPWRGVTDDKMERAATTASSLKAEQDSGNINRTHSMATLKESFPQGTDSVNAGVSKLMLLSINLLLPVLVYAARHSLTAVRHKLMLPDITSYCWFGICSWRDSRVDGRSYLLSGATNSSKANGIIRDPKFELENSLETLKFAAMPFGLTNAPVVFMELMSREEYESHVKMIVKSVKEEKMYVKFSNNVEAEQRGSYLDVEGIKWVMSRSWHYRKEQTIS
ncbi:hypothetical protein Tco_1229682 [Tanacetum coccineum]